MKKSTWNIRVLQEVTLKIIFDKEVSEEEAIELYESNNFEDIYDETDHYVVNTLYAE